MTLSQKELPKIILYVWLVTFIIFIILFVEDIYSVLIYPNKYPWSTELGFRYESKNNYISIVMLSILLLLSAIMCHFKKSLSYFNKFIIYSIVFIIIFVFGHI